MNFKERMKQLKRQLMVVVFTFRDARTPWYAKVLSFLSIAYAASPIDLIPVIGNLDDLLIVPALIWLALRVTPRTVLADAEEKARKMADEQILKRWYYAIPIVLIWLLVLVWIGSWFIR